MANKVEDDHRDDDGERGSEMTLRTLTRMRLAASSRR
jgi:hypothetical protein